MHTFQPQSDWFSKCVKEAVSNWPFALIIAQPDQSHCRVIILYSANFIAAWEGADNSCWLSAPPSYHGSLRLWLESFLTRGYLGSGAHLLIEKWLTNQGAFMTGNPFSQLAASGRRWRRTEGDDETSRPTWTGRTRGRMWKRHPGAEAFIVIPSGEGAIQQLKCPLSVSFKSEQ